MLDLYDIDDGGQRRVLMDLARGGNGRRWWADWADLVAASAGLYLELEAEATTIRIFSTLTVPGLLQTRAYAAAAIAARRPSLTTGQVQRLTELQLRRQDVLDGPDPARLHVLLDEPVLLRHLGARALMRAQLRSLAQACAQPGLTIQVLPLGASQLRAISSSHALLSFSQPDDPGVAVSDGIGGQVLVEQRPALVHDLRLSFETLAASALPAPQSAMLISEMT